MSQGNYHRWPLSGIKTFFRGSKTSVSFCLNVIVLLQLGQPPMATQRSFPLFLGIKDKGTQRNLCSGKITHSPGESGGLLSKQIHINTALTHTLFWLDGSQVVPTFQETSTCLSSGWYKSKPSHPKPASTTHSYTY